jgi:hypothetical protein
MLHHVVWKKLTDVSEVHNAPIIRAIMMDDVSTSETLVNLDHAMQCNIPEDSHIHNRCCENLKSHTVYTLTFTLTLE